MGILNDDVSARLIREHGIDGVRVSDLMGAAGLTHRGFHGHFNSQDELAAAARRPALEHTSEHLRERIRFPDAARPP
jgi:TetR/AcrR family transcriptional repressor of nem operon